MTLGRRTIPVVLIMLVQLTGWKWMERNKYLGEHEAQVIQLYAATVIVRLMMLLLTYILENPLKNCNV